jgi:hypothetical protein
MQLVFIPRSLGNSIYQATGRQGSIKIFYIYHGKAGVCYFSAAVIFTGKFAETQKKRRQKSGGGG